MRGPPAGTDPLPGHEAIEESGFTYLPRFFSVEEASNLADYFGSLHPQWEQRHPEGGRRGTSGGLTRPVYWLGAWQFAALGYYAEPDHVLQKCVRAEPIPERMLSILRRLQPVLEAHGDGSLPNTCLINYYGQRPKGDGRPPVDLARLRMHRDGEPGPVVMISVGQPAQFEFVEPEGKVPAHSQWIRNRSVVVLSGPTYKDHLYHRVTRVRYGLQPVLSCQTEDFEVRRISVSFRHVPEDAILDFGELAADARDLVRPHIVALAEHSAHFRDQLLTARG